MGESVGGKVLEQDGENQEPNEWGDPLQVPSLLWSELPHMITGISSPHLNWRHVGGSKDYALHSKVLREPPEPGSELNKADT